MNADDGFSFNGNGLSLSNGTTRSPTTTETSSGVVMTPGLIYNFSLAYMNYTAATTSTIQLLWRRAGGALEIVPREAIHARGRRDYYSFAGAPVAMKDGVISSAPRTVTYLHGDHLGSASLATNASGAVVSQMRYKQYGELRWTSGADMPTDKRFNGQMAQTAGYVGSLYDYSARFYSPALGRFVSADTIVPGAGNGQAFNRYMYVLGNPLANVDKDGHCPIGSASLGVLGVINCVGLDALVFVGLAPDLGGISNATAYASSINAAAAVAGVPAIYVAAGIAIKSQWCCSLGDVGQLVLNDIGHDITRQSDDSSQGIAQMARAEMARFAGGQSRFDNIAAIGGFAAKIADAIARCENCGATDSFIAAGIGQNYLDVKSVVDSYMQDGKIAWGAYFDKQGDFKIEPGLNPIMTLKRNNENAMSGGRGWDLHLLRKFYWDILALVKLGWRLPEEVDMKYIGCLAKDGGASCDAAR
ncbi:MAG: RHS repeat-associated core domain-containing protein [Thermoflexales bacterium]